MYTAITREQVYAFINSHRLTGHLATVREDGRPHVAPIWIATDGEDIVWNTGEDTVKGRNLLRTGYAAISMDDSVPPFNSVRLEGPVVCSTNLDEVRLWAAIIGGRYMGDDQAEAFGERNGVPGEILCRMTPTRVSGIFDVAAFPETELAG
jgi:PPOX class probable F420-dependent enzyme